MMQLSFESVRRVRLALKALQNPYRSTLVPVCEIEQLKSCLRHDTAGLPVGLIACEVIRQELDGIYPEDEKANGAVI